MKVFITSLILGLVLALAVSVIASSELFAAKQVETSSYSPASNREGFYMAIHTGELFFTGKDRTLYKDAWLVGFKSGYDIAPWIGFEGQFNFSGHDTTKLNIGTSVPTSFNLFQLSAGGKLGYQVMKRLKLGANIGGGIAYSSPNLQSVGGKSKSRMMGYAAFEMEFFTRIKHLSIGLDPALEIIQDLKSAVVVTTGYVRFTF